MKRTRQDYTAGCIVLCNYLDGAVADYENGNTDEKDFIHQCISALKLLGDLSWEEYYDRMRTAETKRLEINL